MNKPARKPTAAQKAAAKDALDALLSAAGKIDSDGRVQFPDYVKRTR